MKIRAILYDNSSSLSTNAQSMASAAGSDLASIVFNVHNGPFDFAGSSNQSHISAAITDMHNNYPGVKILGYVDSGGAQFPSGDTCSTSVSSNCDNISRTPTLCTADGTGTYWSHYARTSTDHDLNLTNCYINYHGNLRRQTLFSNTCTDVLNYMYTQIDEWITTLGADGIMVDNVYPGPVGASGWSWSSSDSHYVFYKDLCDHITSTYSGSFVLLNAAGYIVPEEWISTTKSASNVTNFFSAIQVYESPYLGGSCTFPPNHFQGGAYCTPLCGASPGPNTGTLPTWLTSSKYPESLFFASLFCANSSYIPTGSAVTTYYGDCCSNGIGTAYISTQGNCTGGGSYTGVPSNWSDQVSAASTTTSC